MASETKRKPVARFCGNCQSGELQHEDWMDDPDREWPYGYPVECACPLPISITYPEGGGTYQKTPAEECFYWKLHRKAKP